MAHSHPYVRVLILAALLLSLGACGGGSKGEPTREAPGTVGDDPEGAGGVTPPAAPPEGDPPPPGEPPRVPPPGGEESPRAFPPPEAPEPLPSYAGFDDVRAVAADPDSDAWFAIRGGTGELLRMHLGRETPESQGTVEVDSVRGLAFGAPAPMPLYAIARADETLTSELCVIDPLSADSQRLGPLGRDGRVDAIALRRSDGILFGVDVAVVPPVLVRIDVDTREVTDIGSLGEQAGTVTALTHDPEADLLYAADIDHGTVLIVDPETGKARPVLEVAEGPMDGLAYLPSERRFLGVRAALGTLYVLDLMGSRFEWAGVRALALDPQADVLYAVHMASGALLRVDPESTWHPMIGHLPIPRLEGLAYDAERRRLYGLSSATHGLYRIDPESPASYEDLGQVQDSSGSPWTELCALAPGRGVLYAADGSSRAILQVDPDSAAATVVTTFPEFPGVHSLAFDAITQTLHVYSDADKTHLALDLRAGFEARVVSQGGYQEIGGLAWIPEPEGRLVGTALLESELVDVSTESPADPVFDQVEALALNAQGRLLGFDTASSRMLEIDVVGAEAAPLGEWPDLRIEAMAAVPPQPLVYAIDNRTHTLWLFDRVLSPEAVPAEGALEDRVIKALAYVPVGPDPEVRPLPLLVGIDAHTHEIVTIGLEDASVQPVAEGVALPWDRIEAMAYDDRTDLIVAVDRSSRALIEISPNTWEAVAIPDVTVEFSSVGGLVSVSGTEELILVDADSHSVVLVHRFTGETLQPFPEIARQRGAGDDGIVAWWPCGETRLEAIDTFALQVDAEYDGRGALVFRRGDAELHRAPFDPESLVMIEKVPAGVRKALEVGDVVRWGLDLEDGEDVLTEFTVVQRPEAAAAITGFEKRAHLDRYRPVVRESLQARVLLQHDLPGEALVAYLRLAAEHEDYPEFGRGFLKAMRALGVPDEQIAKAQVLLNALGPAPTDD